VRIALDTNVFVYAEGVQHSASDAPKVEASRSLLTGLTMDLDSTAIAPVQVLLELHHVLTRKGGHSPDSARAAVQRLVEAIELEPTTPEILTSAMDLVVDHQLQIFDAVILAAAAASGCEILLSEDLQEGFRFRGVTVQNPFAARPAPTIRALLGR